MCVCVCLYVRTRNDILIGEDWHGIREPLVEQCTLERHTEGMR